MFLKRGKIMKKLAILGSAESEVLEAILNYFKEKDVDITCISNDEHSNFFKKAKDLCKNTKYLSAENMCEYFASHDIDLIAMCDFRGNLNDDVLDSAKFINIHPSLLPAFKGPDAISRAFKSGVKVSGVTIYRVKQDIENAEIIAQYPVLIGNLTHFDEFKESITELSAHLYPIVIEKILNDEVFDFSDLIGGCNSSCGGCGNCH